jgi:hypothetical protein
LSSEPVFADYGAKLEPGATPLHGTTKSQGSKPQCAQAGIHFETRYLETGIRHPVSS